MDAKDDRREGLSNRQKGASSGWVRRRQGRRPGAAQQEFGEPLCTTSSPGRGRLADALDGAARSVAGRPLSAGRRGS